MNLKLTDNTDITFTMKIAVYDAGA